MIPALSLLSYPQECPYGEGDVYCGFQNPYLLVYLPVSLGTASQRAQAPPGVACPYNFPAVLDLPIPGPVCCWHSKCSKWPGCRLFSCSGGCWGRLGSGWRQAFMGKKEVTFTHIWLSYGVSLALQWIELPCLSCLPPPPLYSKVKSLGKSVF